MVHNTQVTIFPAMSASKITHEREMEVVVATHSGYIASFEVFFRGIDTTIRITNLYISDDEMKVLSEMTTGKILPVQWKTKADYSGNLVIYPWV